MYFDKIILGHQGITANCPEYKLPEIKLPNGNIIPKAVTIYTKMGVYTTIDEIKKLVAQGDYMAPVDSVKADVLNLNRQAKFLKWQYNNIYCGKQFSILGDSISTLDGYNPKGYKVFYSDDNCEKSGVMEMKETWWGKVIDFFGGELLVNNSWSGSRVTKLPQSDKFFPSGCSDERTGRLHINNIMPDVIIVYLSTNDWAFGAQLCFVDYLGEDLTPLENTFYSAYSMMLRKLKKNYPHSEIWCCTLNSTYMSVNSNFSFPEIHNGNDIKKYNNVIKDCVRENSCKLIDLYANQLPYDSIDGSHPNADGMNTLAVQIIREMSDEKSASFLDCKTEHDYVRLEGYYDVMAYKCRKCGKEKMENAYTNPDWDTCVIEYEQAQKDESLKNSNNECFCNKCGNVVKEKDKFCSKCGSSLAENSEFDICPNCNKRTLTHTVGSDYCTNCNYEALLYIGVKSPYIWNSVYMNTENIRDFTASFGDCPIVHISFDGEKLTVYNRINGSKDGWMRFSDDFFDNKIVNLTDEQKNEISEYIKAIDFSNWETEDYIRENYEMGACGFCINNSFTCTFNNGEYFKCYEPKYEAFNQLVDFLKKFCDNSWFEHFSEKTDENEENTVLLIEKYDPQYKYVSMNLSITRCLYDNKIKLFVESKAENIVLNQEVVSIGRNESCDIKLNYAEVSKQHARFYHEGSTWFIADTNSTNGIWLNGNKIEPNTKYELFPDDVIDIAHIDKFVFYKAKSDENFLIKQQPIILTSGTEIDGNYELPKQIGQGAFTKTYLAVDKRLNKMWAAKICVKNNSSMSIIEAIMNEAYMVKKLVHKAIPRIVDIIDNNEYFCIIEDYVEGATLKDIVDNYGAQPQYKVIDWAKQLCDVLGYLHVQNPPHIYRDVKPGNIILRLDGNIVLIDFGIMRTYKPNNLADTVALGTKGYAAPEQYGTRQTDIRTDIFGLGMTIHHLLTGVDPTENNGCTLPICQINSELSKGLEYIVSKCIELDPDNRYQSCLELLNDLNRYQQLPPKKNLFSKILGKK